MNNDFKLGDRVSLISSKKIGKEAGRIIGISHKRYPLNRRRFRIMLDRKNNNGENVRTTVMARDLKKLIYDPIAANVYADYLEEIGENQSAIKLRKAFPLDNGQI